MIHKLEKILFEKTKDSQSDILYTQWIYDKKLVPRALSLIAGIFPHYSMHDQSHSETVINNIVRIVGEDVIEKFTAIDIWLLLTSAYYHDIGMAIPADRIEETLKSKDFLSYISDIQSDLSHPLYLYASHFKEEHRRLVLKDSSFNINIYDSVKFLLADYFRRFHANRSEQIIINPEKEISLNSPRGVIPQRLIKILGAICASHTEDFNKVLELPKNEVGIDINDAHPRYIACLLRLGDLLDLDNNRFSDVFLRSVKSIPKDSLLHKEKHFSITHFSVDTTTIDITASCDDYNVANITQSWFEYIRQEIVNQMLNWNNIVPNKSMGYLPTIKNLKVNLNTWRYIHDKEKPRFKVDNEQALQLLKGAGLYQTPWQCLREILQNSVDASLLRLWLEKNENDDFNSPNDSKLLGMLENYPINVTIEEVSKSDNEDMEWKITVEDNGIGLSINDLEYLSITGSSRKNKIRNQIISEMPEWLQPSGEFGIGFQSIFMITDLVHINTKSFFTQQELEIELSNPDSERRGDILIKQVASTYKRKPGTILSFRIKTSPIFPQKEKQDYTDIKINKYKFYRELYIDPFEHKKVSAELEFIIQELNKFAKASCLDIYLSIRGDKHILNDKSKGINNTFQFFNQEEQIQFNIIPKVKDNETIFYYKGQRIESRIDFNFLCFEVNILKCNAKDIVSLDRNYLKYEFEFDFFEVLKKCIIKEIPKYAKEQSSKNDIQHMISMFVNYYWEDDYNEYLNLDTYQQWKEYQITINNGNQYKLGYFVDNCNDIYIYDYAYGPDTPINSYEIKDNALYIHDKGYDELAISRFLYRIFKKYFQYISEEESSDKKCRILHLSKTKPEHIIYENNLLEYITGKSTTEEDDDDDIFSFIPANLRYIIPCEDKYKALKLKDAEDLKFVDTAYFPSLISNSYPKMISPFTFRKDEGSLKYIYEVKITEFLIDWVKEHNDNPSITREEIKEAYSKFVDEYNGKLNRNTN